MKRMTGELAVAIRRWERPVLVLEDGRTTFQCEKQVL